MKNNTENSNLKSIRDSNVRLHSYLTFFLKSISVVTNFALVPVTIKFFGAESFGLYLTLISIASWLSFIDIGISFGFRNKLAQAYANKDYKLSKIYVSTTYALVGIIGLTTFLILLVINSFLDWQMVLNSTIETKEYFRYTAVLVLIFTILNYITKLINVVLYATQNASAPVGINLISNLFILITLYFGTDLINPSLFNLVLIYCIPLTLSLTITTIFLFTKKYSFIRPSFSWVRFNHTKSIINLGVKFFILQIEIIILFQAANFFIIQFFGPLEVSQYATATRYFSIIQLVFALIMNVYWSAVTDAITKDDYDWIRKSVNSILRRFFLILPLSICMFFFSEIFFEIWLGDKLTIPYKLSFACFCTGILAAWNSIFEYILNGASKIFVMSICAIVTIIIFVPLVYLYVNYLGMGPEGIVFSIITCQLINSFVTPYQYYLVINKKDTGIWSR